MARLNARSSGLIPICSWPCFEFWILLHFGFTRKPYDSSGGKTPGQNCLKDLQNEFSDYDKNLESLFKDLIGILEVSKKNLKSALNEALNTNEYNPSTEIHVLVEYLQSLASESLS